MTVREQVLDAAARIALSKPSDQITYAEIAAEAGVHWTAVRRHLGDKQAMRAWLQERQAEHEGSFADTRTRIMEAAAKMFAEQGYTQASLDRVAAEAGLTKGAVYWHFSSKQDLFLAILERDLERQLRVLPSQIDQVLKADDPEAALRAWLTVQLMCIEGNEGNAMLFFEFVTSSREPEVREKLRTMYGQVLDAAATMLVELQGKGIISQGLDPDGVAIMVSALNKGILMEWLIHPERCKMETLVATISKVLWGGIAPKR